MAKHAAVATRLLPSSRRPDSPLSKRLNSQVLQTLKDLSAEIETDPGIEDEYEFELFGNVGPKKQESHK